MCGRFTLATPQDILAALFAVEGDEDWGGPRYNIAPQTRIRTVRPREGGRRTQSLLWGALRPGDARPVINARCETISTSPLFNRGFLTSRLLIPADGFYEWTRDRGDRRAHYFQQPGGQPFGLAGIGVTPVTGRAGIRTGADGEETAVILTTAASDSIKPYHDRMPVLVPALDFEVWLDPTANSRVVAAILAASPSQAWAGRRVGPLVNQVRNDAIECIRPDDGSPDRQGRLF